MPSPRILVALLMAATGSCQEAGFDAVLSLEISGPTDAMTQAIDVTITMRTDPPRNYHFEKAAPFSLAMRRRIVFSYAASQVGAGRLTVLARSASATTYSACLPIEVHRDRATTVPVLLEVGDCAEAGQRPDGAAIGADARTPPADGPRDALTPAGDGNQRPPDARPPDAPADYPWCGLLQSCCSQLLGMPQELDRCLTAVGNNANEACRALVCTYSTQGFCLGPLCG